MKFSMSIVLIFLLFSIPLFALESEPSETVGYVKVEAISGYTPFSLPFTFFDVTYTETLDLDDIIGNQLTGGDAFTGDQVYEVGGAFAYYNSSTEQWSGILENFTDNKAYYFKIQSGHSEADVYLAGTVLRESQSIYCDIGYTILGIREAGVIAIEDLDLIASGFTGGSPFSSDQIIELGGGYAYYNTDTSSWNGTLTDIEPAKVYYIQVKTGHSAFTWNYNPTSRSENVSKVEMTENAGQGGLK
ncbi:MAG: hypothetical protein APR54_00030 [Candidatus Cloacimonas sp. SDB]|nr:MAG: hypothetical protein APR54_00030 [Candidatus Cloacimonas sp. SDB]